MFGYDIFSDSMQENEAAGDVLKDGLSERKPLMRPWDKVATQTPRTAYIKPNNKPEGEEDADF